MVVGNVIILFVIFLHVGAEIHDGATYHFVRLAFHHSGVETMKTHIFRNPPKIIRLFLKRKKISMDKNSSNGS